MLVNYKFIKFKVIIHDDLVVLSQKIEIAIRNIAPHKKIKKIKKITDEKIDEAEKILEEINHSDGRIEIGKKETFRLGIV